MPTNTPIFQLRGDSLEAYYARALKEHTVMGGTDANLPILDSALPGVWGGKVIDLSQRKPLCYVAADNWAINTNEFTIHIRFRPKWDGDASVFQSISNVSNSNYVQGGCLFGIDGPLLYTAMINANGSGHYNGDLAGTSFAYDSTKIMDLYLVDRPTSVKAYANYHGAVAALLATIAASAGANRPRTLAASLMVGAFDFRNCDIELVEFNIIPYAIDPIALGIRTDFMAVPGNFERYAQSAPAREDVRKDVAFIDQGETKLGLADMPDESDVAATVIFDNGTKEGTYEGLDRFDVLDDENVVDGFDYLANGVAKTGTRKLSVTSALTLVAQGANAANGIVKVTQGDSVTLSLVLKTGSGFHDLSGAVFETTFPGSLVAANGAHTRAVDQTTDPGEVSLVLSPTDTAKLKQDAAQEVITKVTQSGNILYFHGKILTVLSAKAGKN